MRILTPILAAAILTTALPALPAHAQEATGVFRAELSAPIFFSTAAQPGVEMPTATAIVGVAFSQVPEISNISPTQWELDGQKPSWLQFDSTSGRLWGTPMSPEAALGQLVLTARDAAGRSVASEPFAIDAEYPFVVTPPLQQTWRPGRERTATVQAGAVDPTWSLVAKPAWLSIDQSGVIHGNPTSAQNISYRVRAADGANGFSEADGFISVLPALSFTAQPQRMQALKDLPLSQQVTVGNQPAEPVEYRLVDGNGSSNGIPSWLSMSSTGSITAALITSIAAQEFGPYRVSVLDADGYSSLSNEFFVDVVQGAAPYTMGNLQYTQCDAGQVPVNSSCTGARLQMAAAQAITYCNNLVMHDRSDWRLPSRADLEPYINIRGQVPNVLSSAANPRYYLTSNPNGGENWIVYPFHTTTFNNGWATGGYDVRCVRTN